eukprot:scaffold20651_cov42-Cyclotella_meneghiniana.AAC.5
MTILPLWHSRLRGYLAFHGTLAYMVITPSWHLALVALSIIWRSLSWRQSRLRGSQSGEGRRISGSEADFGHDVCCDRNYLDESAPNSLSL